MIKLTNTDGTPVWVNPTLIVTVSPDPYFPWDGGDPSGSVVRFISNFEIMVKEPPEELAQLVEAERVA